MPIVNLKLARTPNSRPGMWHSFITEMAFFTLETDDLRETGYPFGNSRFEWTILLTLSVNFGGQFGYGLSVSDSLCIVAPSPKKKSEKGCLWGRGRLFTGYSQTRGWSISSSSVKTAINKIPVSSVFNKSERLYRTTVSCYLVRRPHYSARLMRFGSGGPSEIFSHICHRNYLEQDCVGRSLTGTRHGNVYCSVREKQGIVVYR